MAAPAPASATENKNDSSDAPESLPPKQSRALTHAELTFENVKKFYKHFDSGDWKLKKLKGNWNCSRSPCILLKKPAGKQIPKKDGLHPYQAMYQMQYGKVSDGSNKEISHMCCTEKKKGQSIQKGAKEAKKKKQGNQNRCINVEHMRLEDKEANGKRFEAQYWLLKEKAAWQRANGGYMGPLFWFNKRITTDASNVETHASFTNCGILKDEFSGFYVHKPTATLRRHLNRLKAEGIIKNDD